MRSSKVHQIDPGRMLKQRRALKEFRERQSVVISTRRFSPHGMTARVLIDRDYYDVGEGDLGKLMDGRTPEDLELYPVQDVEFDR